MINDYSRAYKDIYYIIMAIEEEYRKKIPSDLKIHFFQWFEMAKFFAKTLNIFLQEIWDI